MAVAGAALPLSPFFGTVGGQLVVRFQGTLEAARVVQDKPDALQPRAESWAQAYVASGDLVAGVAKLKAQDGKPMTAQGGAAFARSLIAHGLVDRFDLTIVPFALGQGLAIFTELTHPAPHPGQLDSFSQRLHRTDL